MVILTVGMLDISEPILALKEYFIEFDNVDTSNKCFHLTHVF